jgi:hypothetical protein
LTWFGLQTTQKNKKKDNTKQQKYRQHKKTKKETTQINKKTDNTNQQKDRQHKSTKRQTAQINKKTDNSWRNYTTTTVQIGMYM